VFIGAVLVDVFKQLEMRPSSRDGFTIAIICALALEAEAVEELFDETYDRSSIFYKKLPGDDNEYVNGRIGMHNIVLCYMPGMGIKSAVSVAASMRVSYTRIEVALVIGVCGGAPYPSDTEQIFLGDVIISNAVIEYDFGRQSPGIFKQKTGVKDTLGGQNRAIRSLLAGLKTNQTRTDFQGRMIQHLHAMQKRGKWRLPSFIDDILFKASYEHRHYGPISSTCLCFNSNSPGDICNEALGTMCSGLGCSENQICRRRTHAEAESPRIHVGIIASSDTVMKSGEHRDNLVKSGDVVGFDMGGAGVGDIIPCILVKGVCDYADSHKNKLWQVYAAATGASAAKAFLEYWRPRRLMIPFERNPRFVGRHGEIRQLEEWIFMSDGPKRLAITGLGGVGKTQLALELAYRMQHRDDECSIFWIPCTSYKTVEQACMTIAQMVGIQNVKPAEVKEHIKAYFSQKNWKWLLIFDNADDLDMWAKDISTTPALDFLPHNNQGHIIFTTRSEKLAVELASVMMYVRELDQETGVEFLEKSLVQKSLLDDRKAVIALLKQLTFLPLAVAQAAAYINESGIRVSDYLLILQEQEGYVVKLLSKDFGDHGRYKDTQNPIAMTWLISFYQVQKTDQLAADYLALMACVDPHNIPRSFLPQPTSRKRMVEALGLLVAYSFVTLGPGNKTITVHRLVHLATRNWLNKEHHFYAYIKQAADRFNDVFPDSDHANGQLWREYLPHALTLLSEPEFRRQQQQYLRLIENMGQCLCSDGRFNEAEVLFRDIMAIQQTEHGDRHPSTLSSTANLGTTYRFQGRWNEAEKVEVQVVETRKQVLGPEHPDTLTSMANLASTYRYQGRWYEAEMMDVQVVETRKQVLGLEHPETLTSMAELASVLSRQGVWEDAEELHRQVIKTRRVVLGEEHPSTLTSMVNLSSLYKARGRFTDAEELDAQIADIQKRRLLHDIDTDSEILDTPSILSEASSNDSMSSSGPLHDTQSAASEYMARRLFEDKELQVFYREALVVYGKEKFAKFHDRFLKRFFRDLRLESQGPLHLRALRFVRIRPRRERVTKLICEFCDPNPSLGGLWTKSLPSLKEDRELFLNRHPKSLVDKPSDSTSSAVQGTGSTVNFGIDDPDSVDEDEEDDEDSEEEEDNVDQTQMLQQLNSSVVEYFTNGIPFQSFKANVRYFINPPITIKEAIDSRNVSHLRKLLKKQFDLVARDEYAWIQELHELGYSHDLIADLLFEEANDDPWIYFEPKTYKQADPQPGMHLRNCAHGFSLNNPFSDSESTRIETVNRTEIVQVVQELCGLAGISPASRELQERSGSVKFEEQNTVAVISYSTGGNEDKLNRTSVILRVYQVFERFCSAASQVQAAGLCCDSFTFLRFANEQLVLNTPSLSYVEMCRVQFELISQMKAGLRQLLDVKDITLLDIIDVRGTALQVLKLLGQDIAREFPMDTVDRVLNYCSLAAQFLSLGFLSYIQAHVGPVQFFFLDTLQSQYVLCGNQVQPGHCDRVIASLTNLTCMGNMIQGPVLAFKLCPAETKFSFVKGGLKYDIIANIEDILDTWGPGQLVVRCTDSRPCAIRLGGGFITSDSTDGRKFHWSRNVDIENLSPMQQDWRQKVLIGAVTINRLCTIDENQYWSKSSTVLEPLGTYSSWWELNQKQSGFQAGNYVLYQINGVWCKMHGRTLKQSKLEQDDEMLIPFLEDLWGLQVSFCTSVARRVTLREMVADLLPTFATTIYNNEQQKLWEELENNHNIIECLKGSDLSIWFRSLSPQLYEYTLSLIRKIFNVLQHTGIDREGKYLSVSWPHQHDLQRCFRIPCEKQSSWARILADSEDCATFAYVSSRCLETHTIKCNGPLRTWKNTTLLLETAVLCHSENPITNLENDRVYFFRKLDSFLYVKVQRRSETSAANLITSSTSIPRSLQRRLFMREEQRRRSRLREKQAAYDTGETVIVLATKDLL
jgi:nucleoside phosphorylase